MDYTCFAADDDLVIRDFNKGLLVQFNDPDVSCFSLRLGLNINYCYSNDKPNTLKDHKNDGDFIKWGWRKEELDFAYPLSVVSHIFKTDFIKSLTERINFINPNTYEGTLQSLSGETKPLISSYKESRIFGVPANSVNESWTNRNGLKHGYTTKELNDKYLEGLIINVAAINPKDINASQQEIEYEFK